MAFGTELARARVVIVGDTAALKASLTSAEQHMLAAGKRMQKVGRNLSTRLTLPIVAIGAVAVHSAAKFDESMRRMAGLVGIPQQQLNEWRDDIRDMGVEFGSSGQEAAEAMFFITSASLRGQRALDTLRASLMASAIGLGEVKTVADAATSAMNAYAKSGLTATRATEILAAGVRKGKLEAASLGPVIGRLTGTASALGVSFEDVIATLATFSLTGFDAALGATSLVSIMSTLLGTSEEGEKLLRQQGLSLEYLRDVIKEPRGLIQAMRLLDEAFEGNVSQLETVIPNLRAIRGVLAALAQDASIVDNVFEEVTESQGILTEALTAAQGPMFRLKQAWAAVKDAMIEVGDALIPVVVPMFKGMADAIRSVARAFGELPGWARTSIVVVVGLVAVLGPLLLIVGAVTAAVAVLGGTGALIVAAFAAVGVAVIQLIRYWDDLKEATASLWRFIKRQFLQGVDKVLAVLELLPNRVGAAAAAMRTQLAKSLGNVRRDFEAPIPPMMELRAQLRMLELQLRAGEISYVDYVKNVRRLSDAIREEASKEVIDYATKLGILHTALKFGAITQEEYTAAVREAAVAQQEAAAAAAAAAATGLPDTPPPWLEAATTATTELENALRTIRESVLILGDEFDVVSAKTEAYKTVVQALMKAGALVDPETGRVRAQFRELVDTYLDLRLELGAATEQAEQFASQMARARSAVDAAKTPADNYAETLVALHAALEEGEFGHEVYAAAVRHAAGLLPEVAAAQAALNKQYSRAAQAVAAARTPQDEYRTTLEALKAALDAGRISYEEFVAAVRHAAQVLDEAKGPVDELRQGLIDIASRATDAFVDFAFEGGNAIHEFVKRAIMDIAKLILKLELMKALEKHLNVGDVGSVVGLQRGGFLEPGQIGVVGEAGPEIITGGRQGVRVTPMAQFVQKVGSGGPMQLEGIGAIGEAIKPEAVAPDMAQFARGAGGALRPEKVGVAADAEGVAPIITRFLQELDQDVGSVVGLQRGGFLRPGEIGVVGEAGPEVITGGRRGVRVTPVSAPAAAAGGGELGETRVALTFNVNAMDSRDITRFLRDNEGAIAVAVSRAAERSTALRRRLS